MPVERRGWGIAFEIGSTGNGRNPIFNGRRQPSCGGTSGMTRECQVRICERLGVKFPGPTRPGRLCGDVRLDGEYLRVTGPSADIGCSHRRYTLFNGACLVRSFSLPCTLAAWRNLDTVIVHLKKWLMMRRSHSLALRLFSMQKNWLLRSCQRWGPPTR